MWAVLHAVFLFWGVSFPFSYRQLRISGRIHYAYIISVLLALTLPLPSALIPLKDGYLNFRNPALSCVGRNVDYSYYILVLPLSIVLGVTSCLLVLTFTYLEVEANNTRDHMEELILCETIENLECNVNLDTYHIFRALSVVAIVLLSFLPVVALLFSFDPKICRKIKEKLSSS